MAWRASECRTTGQRPGQPRDRRCFGGPNGILMFISAADMAGGGVVVERGRRHRVWCGRGREAKEGSQQRTDRHRTCFLMSQLITFTPEWEKRAGEDRSVCERVTEALMLFH